MRREILAYDGQVNEVTDVRRDADLAFVNAFVFDLHTADLQRPVVTG